MKYSTIVAFLSLPIGMLVAEGTSGTPSHHESEVAYTSQPLADGMHEQSQAQPSKYNYQAHPKPEQPDQRYGFTVYGDYLYWKPYMSNTPWVLLTDNGQNSPIPADGVQKIDYKNLPFTFSGASGFRLGVGNRLDWHKLGFNVEWTRFHTSDKETVSNNAQTEGLANDTTNPKAISGIWAAPRTVGDGVAFYGRANGTLKIDQIDFIFSTMYEPVTWFAITPGVGIRTYLSSFSLDVMLERNRWGDTNIVSAPPYNTENETVLQDFDSVGALLSLKSSFDICWGIRSITDLGLGLVSGNLKNTSKSELTQLGASSFDTMIENKVTIKSIIDFALGLQYEWVNDPKNFGLLLEVAYEVHYLPDFLQPLLLRNTAFTRVIDYRSDLTFQGLRARAGITF